MSATPKKIVKKAAKPISVAFVGKIFKTEFSNGNTPTENLFKPSQRKESFGVVLSESCNGIGLEFVDSPGRSQLVCRNCC